MRTPRAGELQVSTGEALTGRVLLFLSTESGAGEEPSPQSGF